MSSRRLIPATLAVLAGGCAQLPHNNVLLFGTDTKVALDVSSSATSGGAPQITLGYRRAEAVWMPLAVNDQDCEVTGESCRVTTARETRNIDSDPKQTVEGPVLYQSKKYVSGNLERVDSYSVFASFGAKFTANAAATETSASGGLAQFFATGVAAQRLADNPTLVQALKVTPPETAKEEAEAQSDAADANAAAEIAKATQELVDLQRTELKLVKACLTNDESRAQFHSNIPTDLTGNDQNGDFNEARIASLTDADKVQFWWDGLGRSEKAAIGDARKKTCPA